MCNLHIKETEISRKRSKGIKSRKITYSVILSVLSNKTNLILGFSSPLSMSCVTVCYNADLSQPLETKNMAIFEKEAQKPRDE